MTRTKYPIEDRTPLYNQGLYDTDSVGLRRDFYMLSPEVLSIILAEEPKSYRFVLVTNSRGQQQVAIGDPNIYNHDVLLRKVFAETQDISYKMTEKGLLLILDQDPNTHSRRIFLTTSTPIEPIKLTRQWFTDHLPQFNLAKNR